MEPTLSHNHEVRNELFRVKGCPLCEAREAQRRAAYAGSRSEREYLRRLDLRKRGEI